MTNKRGFITGLIITAIVSVLSPLTQYITSTIITPEYFPNMISYSIETGKMTQAAAEEYLSLKNYLLAVIIAMPIMGILTTAIVAIFTRKKSAD